MKVDSSNCTFSHAVDESEVDDVSPSGTLLEGERNSKRVSVAISMERCQHSITLSMRPSCQSPAMTQKTYNRQSKKI